MNQLSYEPNIIQLSTPIAICGDIHGQCKLPCSFGILIGCLVYDLMKLFSIGGNINETNYLFLGGEL